MLVYTLNAVGKILCEHSEHIVGGVPCASLYVHHAVLYARKYLELWWKNRFGRALVAVIFVPLFSSFSYVVGGYFVVVCICITLECSTRRVFFSFLTSHLNTLARDRNTIEPKLMIIYT